MSIITGRPGFVMANTPNQLDVNVNICKWYFSSLLIFFFLFRFFFSFFFFGITSFTLFVYLFVISKGSNRSQSAGGQKV